MIDKIFKANNLYGLFDNVNEITVALSGGADSVALLHSLNTIKSDFGFTLYAAHYHHGIRGEEADRDLDFCKKICNDLKIQFFYEKGDVPEFAEKNGLSLETAARELRYNFLNRVSKGKIATAHTGSDNVETVVFNIARGTSINGAKGIPAKRDNIIRPLILCSRECIETYCESNNLEYITDSTNLIDDCTRNTIRHKIVPVLSEINSGYVENISKLSYSLCEDADYLSRISNEEFQKLFLNNKLYVKNFGQLHSSIAKRVLVCYFKQFFLETPDTFHIEKMLEVANGVLKKTSLINNFFAVKQNDFLVFTDDKETDIRFKVVLEPYSLEEFNKNKKVHDLFLNNAIDYDKIVGDLKKVKKDNSFTIKLSNSNSTKTLKKLLTEKKIPISMRNELPIYADDLGVVWGFNIGTADRVKVDKSTKKILYFNTLILEEN